MDAKLNKIRLILLSTITFFLTISIYLIYCAIYNINDDQRVLENHDDTNIDVGEFRFEKEIFYLFGFTITAVFLIGLIAVHLKSVCLLLFYSTTGCGMFILLLLILYVESVLSLSLLIILIIANILLSILAAYYGFCDQEIDYKLMDKPYSINLIP